MWIDCEALLVVCRNRITKMKGFIANLCLLPLSSSRARVLHPLRCPLPQILHAAAARPRRRHAIS